MMADLGKGQHSTSQAKPTLVMRVAAGLWFGAVFSILALAYFIYRLPSEATLGDALRSTEVFYWIIAPAFVASLSGYLAGGNILLAERPLSPFLSALCGVIVGLACVSSFIGALALDGTLNGARHGFKQFVWLLIYVGMFLGVFIAVPVMSIGAISGF